MIVVVGSENKAKIQAVEEAFAQYFEEVKVKGVAVESEVEAQPKTLDEIVKGAKNRAKKAFEKEKSDFGVGIEAGIFPFPGSYSGYMDTGCCAIFDGKEFYMGCSPLFEYPKKAIEKVLEGRKEIAEVFDELFGEEEHHKEGQGAVGFLSRGKMPRKEFAKHAVTMALTRIVSKKAYEE